MVSWVQSDGSNKYHQSNERNESHLSQVKHCFIPLNLEDLLSPRYYRRKLPFYLWWHTRLRYLWTKKIPNALAVMIKIDGLMNRSVSFQN